MKTPSKLLLLSTAGALVLSMTSLSASAETVKTTEIERTTYSYDLNHNGVIEPDEFQTYVYTRSDTDGDGFLADEEWNANLVTYYDPYEIEYKTYTYWDKDKDDKLDLSEVDTLITTTKLYAQWDKDKNGQIDTDEFAQGTFRAYDANNDGTLSVSEWKNAIM